MAWFKLASITTTGSAGSATGSSGVTSTTAGGNVIPEGIITEEYIDFTSMPATTDVTISRVMPNGALITLLTTTNVNTDGRYSVKEPSHSTAGAASATDLVYPQSSGRFQVDVAQGDAVANGVVVYLNISKM